MKLATRLAGVLVTLALAPVGLGGCGTPSCLVPIQSVVPAGLVAVPPVEGRPRTNASVCPPVVEFSGQPYYETERTFLIVDAWSITAADLTPIGRATRAAPGHQIEDDTVYAIADVDPATAIAMVPDRATDDVAVYVFRAEVPRALCHYLRGEPPDAFSVCRADSSAAPSPSG